MKETEIFVQLLLYLFSFINFAEAADTIKPAVSLTSPAAGNYKGSISIKGTATDNVGLNRIELYVDGVLAQPSKMCLGKKTCSYDVTCDSTKKSDGPHTLRLRTVDSSKNYADTAYVTINIDNAAPASVLLITSPAASIVSGNIQLTGSAVDPSGISLIIFYYKNSSGAITQIGSDNVAPYNGTFISTAIPNGNYRLYAVAYSILGPQLGNLAASPEILITVQNDLAPPSVSISSPGNNSTVSGILDITATASDDVGVVGVQFKVDDTPLGLEDTTAPYLATWDTTPSSVANGEHRLTAVARDAKGYMASSEVTVIVPKLTTPYKTVRSYVHFGSASFTNANILNETACFTARVNDFIAAKKTTQTADVINSYKLPNSRVLVMQYQNGVGSEAREWSGFYQAMSAQDAIWKDVNGGEVKFGGASFRISDICNTHHDPSDPDTDLGHWIKLLTGVTSNYMTNHAAYNEGFFMDNLGGGSSPDLFAVMPFNWNAASFYSAKDEIVRALKQKFTDKKIYINGYADWSIQRGEPQWTGTSMLRGENSADGMMIEGFSLGGGVANPESPSTEARMRVRLAGAREILDLQKGLIIADYFELEDVSKRLYCLVNYLLVANENSFYGPMISKTDYQSSDLPEYYVDLGVPVDLVYEDLDTDPVKTGFLKRRYQKATVYSNIDDSRTFTVYLDSANYQKMKLVGGGIFTGNGDGIWNEPPLGRVEWEDVNASQVALAPKTAVILRRRPM